MAAPNYSTDLQTINLAQDTGTWDELADWAGGGTIYTDETDYYIQGGNCTSQICTKTGAQDETSLVVDYGSDLSASFTAGETCVFMWQVFLPANAVANWDGGGLRLIVGADLNNFDAWRVGGNDVGRNPYGGWQNVVVDPSNTPDYQDDGATGNGGTYRWFGSGLYLDAAIGKGAPHGVDAIRYGRGTLTVSGGDSGNGYGTFAGMAAANDDSNARWGLFQEQAGVYLWKGLMSFGVSGTNQNACDFRDSNVNITIDIAPRTYRTFNRIEIHQTTSRVDWTGINISSLPPSGYDTPGDLVVVDNADVNFDGCSFTDMGEFTFQSNSTIDNTTFRRCEQVDWGSAAFDGCTFETTRASAAIYTEDLADIDNCTFTGGDEGNNAIHMAASGTYTFIGNTFSGYGASGSPSAAIYHDSGGHLEINVQGGDSPTVYNVGASTSEVNNPVILTLSGIVSGSEVRIYEAGTITELDGVEDSYLDDGTGITTKFEYPYTYVASTYVDIVIHHIYYEYYRLESYLLLASSTSIPISQEWDRWYSGTA